MCALLGFALILGAVSALICPSQYQLMEGRCIRPITLHTDNQFVIDNALPGYREECSKDGAHLPIIKSDDENAIFDRIAKSFDNIEGDPIYILLDFVCNPSTRRLEWVDGTSPSYSRKNSIDFNFDCVSLNKTATSRVKQDDWYLTSSNKAENWFAVFCVIDDYSVSTPCGEYSTMEASMNNKPCFMVFTEPLSWELAQRKCANDFGSLITINSADENKFFWRTAISNNMVEGMHIGAHQSPDDPSKWSWSDGEVPFNGKSYDNFIGSFPIPDAGECAAMMTETSSALWINENCQENEQPFICQRTDFSNLSKDCSSAAPKAGEDFFPPGFPNSDIPCEYVLFVGGKKLVELVVMTLVADEDVDYLEILEGTSGPHLLANLTGTILNSVQFKTEKSNVLRVNWKPNGTGSGRGFRIRYNEVDP